MSNLIREQVFVSCYARKTQTQAQCQVISVAMLVEEQQVSAVLKIVVIGIDLCLRVIFKAGCLNDDVAICQIADT